MKLGSSIGFGHCTGIGTAVSTVRKMLRVDTGQENTRSTETPVLDNLQ